MKLSKEREDARARDEARARERKEEEENMRRSVEEARSLQRKEEEDSLLRIHESIKRDDSASCLQAHFRGKKQRAREREREVLTL